MHAVRVHGETGFPHRSSLGEGGDGCASLDLWSEDRLVVSGGLARPEFRRTGAGCLARLATVRGTTRGSRTARQPLGGVGECASAHPVWLGDPGCFLPGRPRGCKGRERPRPSREAREREAGFERCSRPWAPLRRARGVGASRVAGAGSRERLGSGLQRGGTSAGGPLGGERDGSPKRRERSDRERPHRCGDAAWGTGPDRRHPPPPVRRRATAEGGPTSRGGGRKRPRQAANDSTSPAVCLARRPESNLVRART
jgi:hypothetical protein